MNDDIAISVQDVSKAYRLYARPKDRLVEWLHPLRRKLHREFWALRNVSFDVPKGTTVGIIGRNGSGKTTLLELLCSVLRPTSGAVTAKGRVAPLLALGAGFNPDFTGRDNVVFQCRVLGLSETEIRLLLPQIQAFADIGEFFDQPVKTYSSGMFVRLAFAAATSVDPDILVIDEALAVGDAGFQRKCFQKIRDFQDAGKTVVFVTHDMHMLARLCDTAMLLDAGQVIQMGDPRSVMNQYQEIVTFSQSSRSTQGGPAASLGEVLPHPSQAAVLDDFLAYDGSADRCPGRPGYNASEHRYGDRRAEIVDVLLVADDQAYPRIIDSGSMMALYLKAHIRQDVQALVSGFKLKTIDGVVVYATNSQFLGIQPRSMRQGQTLVHCYHVPLPLADGHYFLDLGLADMAHGGQDGTLDKRFDLFHFSVQRAAGFTGVVQLECTAEDLDGPVASV